VILADDLIDAEPPVVRQMTDVYEQNQCSILGVEEIPRGQTDQYGIVRAESLSSGVGRVMGIVEKPKPDAAPSNLAVVGRYILTPRIFHHLRRQKAGLGGEIQLTDAIGALLSEENVLAYRFAGVRYDCGSKLGYLKATVDYGRKHSEVGEEFIAFLKSR
jgi:UTP--glucose-1-phosphate uridylyltransferase